MNVHRAARFVIAHLRNRNKWATAIKHIQKQSYYGLWNMLIGIPAVISLHAIAQSP